MSSKISRRKFLGYAGAAVGLGASGYFALNQFNQPEQVQELPPPSGASSGRSTRLAIPKNPQNYLPDSYVDFIRWLESISDLSLIHI